MTATYQQELIPVLPLGVWHFKGVMTRATQERVRKELHGVAEHAKLATPQVPGALPFLLKMTNAGEYGWVACEGLFQYVKRQGNGRPWPLIPQTVLEVAREAAHRAGFHDYSPNACLVTYYPAKEGHPGFYRDETRREDLTAPIVILATGDTAAYCVSGGDHDEVRKCVVELESGDVLVMGAAGRTLQRGVTKILAGTSDLLPKGGSLTATLRRVRY